MEVNCEGCAGCCLDWRPLLADERGAETEAESKSRSERDAEDATPDRSATRRRGAGAAGGADEDDGFRRQSLDEDANFVPLARDEVRAFVEAGMADALTPRFWRAADEDEGVEVDGYDLAAIAGRPVFFVGLRKPPKPVAPFGRDEVTWLPTCVFLDPTTLQCRIHESDLYPDECGAYPKHNLTLDQETECERVESAFGGDRLVDDAIEGEPDGLLLGSQAIGEKLFCHPDPDELTGIVERTAAGELTREDRAECLAAAAASSAGTLATSEHHYEWANERALEPGDSWVREAIDDWKRRYDAADDADEVPPSTIAADVEDDRGAPATPGWDALE